MQFPIIICEDLNGISPDMDKCKASVIRKVNGHVNRARKKQCLCFAHGNIRFI